MKVKDRETRLVLESENELVIAQWLKHPEKYAQPKAKAATPSKPTIKSKGKAKRKK